MFQKYLRKFHLRPFGIILGYYCHKLSSLRQHKFIILQFWRPEVQYGSHWAEVKIFRVALLLGQFVSFLSLEITCLWSPSSTFKGRNYGCYTVLTLPSLWFAHFCLSSVLLRCREIPLNISKLFGIIYPYQDQLIIKLISVCNFSSHWPCNLIVTSLRVRIQVSFSSVQFSRSVVSNSLQTHGLQHARPPCASPTPRVYQNSCLLSR